MQINAPNLIQDTQYVIHSNNACVEMNSITKGIFKGFDSDYEPFFYNYSMNCLVKYDSKYGWLFSHN